MSTEITAEMFPGDVLSSPTPVLVDFFLDWSAPCQMMESAIDELSGELSAVVRIVKLNAEKNASIVDKYGLTEFPTLVIFKSGQVVASRNGAIPKDILRAWIVQSL